MSSVGEILKNTREAKGITIEQVAEATSIRVLYLEAIENEQFSLVPGEVYLKGFIRNYANYIGLNGPAMVEKYKEQVEANKKHEHPIQADTNDIKHKQPEQINQRKTKLAKADISAIKLLLEKYVTKRNIVLLASIVVFIAAASFFSSFFSGSKDSEPAKTKQPAVESVQSESANKSQAASVLKDQSGVYIVKDAANIEAQVEFSGDCWTEAYADGKEVFIGMMSAGKTVNWKAEKELQIKVGNVRVAKINCNGQLIPYAPDENGIVVRTFKR
ncbi:MAG: helix-turn-helix domain-containing protein [Acidaminococcaceae bacterium]